MWAAALLRGRNARTRTPALSYGVSAAPSPGGSLLCLERNQKIASAGSSLGRLATGTPAALLKANTWAGSPGIANSSLLSRASGGNQI